MRWSWDLQPHGISRLLTPLIARMGQRQEETIWAGLKQYMEAQEGFLPRQPSEAAAGPALKRTTDDPRPLPLTEWIKTRIEHEVDTRSVRLQPA